MTIEIPVFQENCQKPTVVLHLQEGEPVSKALRLAGLLDLPCGIGKCGKCLIHANTQPTPEEIRLLGNHAIATGLRLACHTRAHKDLRVTLPPKATLHVLQQFAFVDYDYFPIVQHIPLKLTPATIERPKTDVETLKEAANTDQIQLSLAQLKELPHFLRSAKTPHALISEDTVVGFTDEPRSYGCIIDIGTTSVAAILVDLASRKVIATRGEKNVQTSFGADVISRIQQSIEHGSAPLQKAIIKQINTILASFLSETQAQDITFFSLAGNTVMAHLLCGLPANHISVAPFSPVITDPLRYTAKDLGIHSQAPVFLLPAISSYIGSDVVASLLAAGAHTATDTFLLVDFGTNAEIVLYHGGVLYACATAAGPCFEGASLSCGMAGQTGAIDKVFVSGSTFAFTTLGNTPPQGICGSGVIDALALLLDFGALDISGKLSTQGVLFPSISSAIDKDKFLLTSTIGLNQDDIRQVQLAKAAVRAGIEILLQTAQITTSEIQQLYLAGGFGSALNPRSASRIGLIPDELAEKSLVLGNAACFGALRYATERNAQQHTAKLVDQTRYIELSAHKEFQHQYLTYIDFPQDL